MADAGVDYSLVELDELGEKRNGDVQQILAGINGCSTVPNVICSGQRVGGGTEIDDLHREGKLVPLLQQLGCTFGGEKK